MKLYDSRRAPNPRRVRWLMAEKGVDDIEIVDVDLLKGEHKTAEYREKIGRAVVPALELDDGTVITESLAIGRYLESLYPEPNLYGRDAREQAVIEMWTRSVEFGAAIPLMWAVRYGHPAMAVLEGPDVEGAKKQVAAAERSLKRVDRALSEREFIATDRLSIVDIVLVCSMDFARLLKWRPPADLPHLGRWYEAMRARPAAAAGM
jgi:glutathione S-transferase